MTQRSTVRVLLVEDNPADARLVEILLSEAGSSADFEVVHAERFAKALERLEEATFGVILLDLSLPDSSGLETVSLMRAAAPRTPMVVLSGLDDEEVALRAVQQGAQDYLIKGQGDGGLIARTIRYAIERQRAEEELQESEERFRLLVEGVRDYAIFMLDPQGRITTWNEGAKRINGYEAQEILGRHFSTFYTEEDLERGHPEEELRIAASEGRYEEEGPRVRKDGMRFWANVVITALRDEGGDLRGFSKVTRDITERKEAEEALRRSLKELADLRLALDESAIVIRTDVSGKITYVNDKFLEISKYEREELLGQDRRLVDADQHSRELAEDLWRTIGHGLVWRGEISNRAKDGTIYWLDATVVPFFDERGRPERYVAVCNDITARKEAEEALRRSLKEMGDLKFALDESAIVAMTDRDGKITYVNDKFLEISGYEREELLGQERYLVDLDRQPRELVEDLWGTVGRSLVWRGEIEDRAKDGSAYWMETTVVPFLDERGKPYRYVVICNDITARKEAEEALKENEERFRALIQNASDIIVVLEKDGTIRYESPAIKRILGYEPEERVGTSTFDHVHPEDVGWVRKKLAKVSERAQERASMWCRIRHRDGSWCHFETIATNLLHDPAVGGIVLNTRDITQRRQAEEALKESETKYRTLVEQIPAITYIEAVDREERETDLLYVSPQIEATFGYSPEEWMADPELFEKLLHPDDRERVLAEDARTDETGEPFSVEYRQFTRDGRVIWVRDEAVLVRDEEDRPLFWQGIMHDVTDQKRAEERLQSTLDSLLTLHEAAQVLGSTLEREEIGSWLLKIMQRSSGVEAAVIELNGEQPWHTVGPEDLWRIARSTPEAQAAHRQILETGERQSFRLERPGGTEGAYLMGLYLPLRVRDRLIGILETYGPDVLTEERSVETIASLAGHAASALDNARLYEELAERERRLRDLVRQVLAAQEEERRRVAYEVHDGLAQTAAAAHQLLQAFARCHSADSAEGRKTLARALELVQQTVGEARDVIADLRPTALDDFGLAMAIRQQIERLADGDRRIDYEETLGDERLPAAVETALYRVAQEALMNAHKHAASARVQVTLQRRDESVRLRVRDWGRGFRPDEVATVNGPGERVGLSSMRERIALVGGSFEISSEPGAGTEVAAEVPLPEEHAG